MKLFNHVLLYMTYSHTNRCIRHFAGIMTIIIRIDVLPQILDNIYRSDSIVRTAIVIAEKRNTEKNPL